VEERSVDVAIIGSGTAGLNAIFVPVANDTGHSRGVFIWNRWKTGGC